MHTQTLLLFTRDGQTRFLDVKNRQVSLPNGRLWEVIHEKQKAFFLGSLSESNFRSTIDRKTVFVKLMQLNQGTYNERSS